jgi:hypothetical protein
VFHGEARVINQSNSFVAEYIRVQIQCWLIAASLVIAVCRWVRLRPRGQTRGGDPCLLDNEVKLSHLRRREFIRACQKGKCSCLTNCFHQTRQLGEAFGVR